MKGNEIREADGAMQRVSAVHAQVSGSDCTCSGSHWKAVSGREGRADCGQRTSVAAGGSQGDLAGASVDVVSAMAEGKEHSGWIRVVLLPLTLGGEPRGLAD